MTKWSAKLPKSMNFSREFDESLNLFRQKKNVLLAVHERPDGDALGSMTAMFQVLSKFPDKNIVMFSQDPIPDNFKFLQNSDLIVSNISSSSPDLFVGFDYGDFARLGVSEELIAGVPFITFDHHPILRQKGDVMMVDTAVSSTCEILYNFFRHAKIDISLPIATSLLTGIFTDTGGFAHINATSDTFRIAGDLLRCGASVTKLHKYAFSNKSPQTLRIWGHVLKNISHDMESKMSYAAISFEEFSGLGSSLDNFEGIVNVINMPSDVRFSLLAIEHEPQVIKGSLRSEPFKGVDVSLIANALGGGGHKYAAGFEVKNDTLKNVVERVKICAAEVA